MPRPSKYDPEFCDKLLELMRQGFSFEACCGAIGINRQTGYEWLDKYEDFAAAKSIGDMVGQYYWEKKGIDNLVLIDGLKFSSAVWAMTMKNRFGYRDKIEHVGENGGPLKFADLSEKQIDTRMFEIWQRLSQTVTPESPPPAAPKKGKA